MKAKSVNEAIKHLTPRSAEEIKAAASKLRVEAIKANEVAEAMRDERSGTLFCLYTNYENDIQNEYYMDPRTALKGYLKTVKDFIDDNQKYHGEGILYTCIYKIIPSLPGSFSHTYNMRSQGSVTILFENSIDSEDL